jgi:hypothetical protein
MLVGECLGDERLDRADEREKTEGIPSKRSGHELAANQKALEENVKL